MRHIQFILYIIYLILVLSCATANRNPVQVNAPVLPVAPVLTQVSHPSSYDLSDITILLRSDKTAPLDPRFGEQCDQKFQTLVLQTISQEELVRGVFELMRYDPVYYHWCFYAKLIHVEEAVQKYSNDIEARQRYVLNSFQFLAHIADAFMVLFHDSRYMRAGVQYYRKMSAWVFTRPLDLTPEGTGLLVQPIQPFGLGKKEEGGFSILEKYHLLDGH